MTALSSTALTRIETVPSTSPIAAILRRMLAWMDGRNTVEMALPALVATPGPALPVIPEAAVVEKPQQDDGILKPAAIATRVGQLMWAHRDCIGVTIDYDDDDPEKSRHSQYQPLVMLRLPGDIVVRLHRDWLTYTSVTAPDGCSQELKPGSDGPIKHTWKCVQALAIVETLGLGDLLPPDPEDDGSTPSSTLPDRLAQAIGTYVERRVPKNCTETYTHRHESESGQSWKEANKPSPWQDIGEGVLLKVVAEEHYKGPTTHHAWMIHPILGKIGIPGEAIQKGLERRTSASLAEALGMAFELPAHLPMPKGNAQAARVLRICREAIAVEPDLMDGLGTPIAPLINQHLPELMRRHAAASANAPESELAAIDAELMEGIDRVRKTVDEALECSAVARRQEMRTQLAFLELRHPDPVPLLESIPSADDVTPHAA